MAVVRTLIIGLGGIGGITVNRIKEEIVRQTGRNKLKAFQFLYIDSTFNDLYKEFSKPVLDEDTELFKISVDYLDIKRFLENPSSKVIRVDGNEYSLSEVITPIYREEFERRKDIRTGCAGLPIICRVSLLLGEQVKKIYETLSNKLAELYEIDEIQQELNEVGLSYARANSEINVYVVANLGGGTGRGTYELISLLIKLAALSKNIPVSSLRIRFITFLPVAFKGSILPEYSKYNTYAGLKEIFYFQKDNYSCENYIKAKLKQDGIPFVDKVVNSEPAFNFIYLMTPHYDSESGGIAYSSIKEQTIFTANFIANAILSGFDALLLARESNLDRIYGEYSVVKEEGSGKEQIRDYSRILYEDYYIPVKELLDFAELKLQYRLLDDIIYGSIAPFEPEKTRYYLDEIGDTILSIDFWQLIGNKIFSYIKEINSEIDTLKTQESIGGIIYTKEGYKKFQSTVSNIKSILENMLQEIENVVQNYDYLVEEFANRIIEDDETLKIKEIVRDWGLENLKSKLNESFHKYLYEIAKSKGRTIEDIEHEFLSRKKFEEIKENFSTEINVLKEEINQSIKQISASINQVPIFKKILVSIVGVGEYKVKSDIENLINKIEGKISLLKTYLDEIGERLKLLSIKRLVSIYNDTISDIENIKQEVQYKFENIIKLNTVVRTPVYLLLNPKKEADEFYSFVNNIFFNGQLEKLAEKKFINTDVYTTLYRGKILSERKTLLVRLQNIISDIFSQLYRYVEKKGFIPFFAEFIDYAYSKGGETQRIVDEAFEKSIRNLSFLGPLSLYRVENPGEIDKADLKTVCILINKNSFGESLTEKERIDIVKKMFGKLISSRENLNIDYLFVDSKNNDTGIKVLGVHHGLPLCVFKDVIPLQEAYLNLSYDEKVKAHISEKFVYLDEPFGITIISQEKLDYLLKLAYTLKAIEIKNDGIIQIYSSPLLTSANIYVDLEILGKIVSIDNIVFFSDEEKFRVIKEIKNAILTRFINLFYKAYEKKINLPEEELIKLLNVKSIILPSDKKVIPFSKDILDDLRELLDEKINSYILINEKVPRVLLKLKEIVESYIKDYPYDLFHKEVLNELKKYNDITMLEKVFIIFSDE